MSSNSSSSSSVESYPPTLEDLCKSFLVLHPDYEFGVAERSPIYPYNPSLYCPLEPVGGVYTNGNKILYGHQPLKRPMCDDMGVRCWEWIWYIYERAKTIALEAGVELPKDAQDSKDPYRRLWIAENMYRELCSNKGVTAEAYYGRQQRICMERKQKERQDKELAVAREWAAKTGWKSRGESVYTMYPRSSGFSEEDARLMQAYQSFIRCSREEEAQRIKHSNQIASLATKASLTEQEAEAVLAHLDPSSKFKKDTLLALKIFNKFATEHKIRVEDAITIFREYIS